MENRKRRNSDNTNFIVMQIHRNQIKSKEKDKKKWFSNDDAHLIIEFVQASTTSISTIGRRKLKMQNKLNQFFS